MLVPFRPTPKHPPPRPINNRFEKYIILKCTRGIIVLPPLARTIVVVSSWTSMTACPTIDDVQPRRRRCGRDHGTGDDNIATITVLLPTAAENLLWTAPVRRPLVLLLLLLVLVSISPEHCLPV